MGKKYKKNKYFSFVLKVNRKKVRYQFFMTIYVVPKITSWVDLEGNLKSRNFIMVLKMKNKFIALSVFHPENRQTDF